MENNFRLEKVSSAQALDETLRPALDKLKGKKVSAQKAWDYVLKSDDFGHSEKEFLSVEFTKQGLEVLFQKGATWSFVLGEVQEANMSWQKEAFLNLVESRSGTTIKDAAHLSQLTGINELKALRILLMQGREVKYRRALSLALHDGAVYENLLQIEPAGFGLPDSWPCITGGEANKLTTIGWAMAAAYNAAFISKLVVCPDLRTIADDMKAPYSAIIEAFENYKVLI